MITGRHERRLNNKLNLVGVEERCRSMTDPEAVEMERISVVHLE